MDNRIPKEKHKATFQDNNSNGFVQTTQDSEFELSPLSNFKRERIFQGKHGILTLHKSFAVDFTCSFSMIRYPFDYQICHAEIQILNPGRFVEIVTDDFRYTGPDDVMQYYVEKAIFLKKGETVTGKHS